MKPLHPYAIVLGIGFAIAALVTLRHPLFALLVGGIALLGFDMAFKARLENKKDDK